MIDHVRELVMRGDPAVGWSFVTDEALELLRRFLDYLDPAPRGSRSTAAQTHARLEEAIAELLASLGRPLGGGSEQLRNAAHAVADAHADWLEHGEPVVIERGMAPGAIPPPRG